MASNLKLKNSSGKTLTIENSDSNTQDTTLNPMLNTYAVETISALDEVPVGITTVFVKDYHSVLEGGGGVFVYDSTKAKSEHNGGTIIDPTVVFPIDWSNQTQLTAWFDSANAGTGVWIRKYDGAINIKWYGAKGDGLTDDTVAVNKACKFDYVFIPKGTYLVNIVINNRIIMYGEGSTKTRLKPKDINKSIIRYAVVDASWSYNSVVSNIGLYSTSKVGIGFAFGKDSHLDYSVNDEYCRNVTFNNCYFSNLEKAVYCPFGAIGETFNDCGFSNNKYGIYALSNKFGGIMHAGNKYFNQGEFSGNDCAVYIHNTTDGFGGLTFNGTIFEANNIAGYIYSNSSFVPVEFNNVWLEGNGRLLTAGTTTIDSWSGTTLTTQTLSNYTMYLDGGADIKFNGGYVTGIFPLTENCRVNIDKAVISQSSGYTGEPINFSSGSSFCISSPVIKDGFRGPYSNKISIKDVFCTEWRSQIDSNSSRTYSRLLIKGCYNNNLIDGLGENVLISNSCQVPVNTGNGSFTLTGVSATGGPIFNDVTQFTRANFLSNEFSALAIANVSALTTQQLTGYIFISYDIKCISGAICTYTWNRTSRQFLGKVITIPEEGWKRVCGIALNDGVSFGHGVDFNGANMDATWQVANFQLLRFDTLNEATIYLNSNTYAKGI